MSCCSITRDFSRVWLLCCCSWHRCDFQPTAPLPMSTIACEIALDSRNELKVHFENEIDAIHISKSKMGCLLLLGYQCLIQMEPGLYPMDHKEGRFRKQSACEVSFQGFDVSRSSKSNLPKGPCMIVSLLHLQTEMKVTM